MYARTNRCYNEQGSRTNYVRSSIPHCILKLGHNKAFFDPFTFICHPIIWHYIVLTLTVSQNNSHRTIHTFICLSSSRKVSQWYIYVWTHDTHTLPVLNDFLSPVLHFHWQIFNHSVYKVIKDKRPVLRCNFCSTDWASFLLFLPFYNARTAESVSTVQCSGLWTL